MDWSFFPPSTAPKALDIVWCRFPFVEQPDDPGPKARPGLVKRVLEKEVERDGKKERHTYVEVAYGTSQVAKNYGTRDLIIANFADLMEMNLPQMTVFQIDRTATIPWAKEWVGDGVRSPAIGRLNAKFRARLVELQKRGPGRPKP